MHPKVSIFMAVHNGASWLRDVLDSVTTQTYPNIELTLWDNASTDGTRDIVRQHPATHLIEHGENAGFWSVMEQLIAESDAPYVICLTDVVLHPEFVAQAVAALETDTTVGAVQGKIYEQHRGESGAWVRGDIIDALGFRIERSRRITILGHGERDTGQYATPMDVFATEGAVPVFRRAALTDCSMPSTPAGGHSFCVTDPAYRVGGITYADDLDLGWRMTLRGWRQVMVPGAIGWHDRSTTKGTAQRPVLGQLARRTQRAALPVAKRRLDWSNVRFSIIKNDSIINILKDLPYIAAREVAVLGYTLMFEPAVLGEAGRFFRLLPMMLRRRAAVQAGAKASAHEMHTWIA